jgi:hypothetical protein
MPGTMSNGKPGKPKGGGKKNGSGMMSTKEYEKYLASLWSYSPPKGKKKK